MLILARYVMTTSWRFSTSYAMVNIYILLSWSSGEFLHDSREVESSSFALGLSANLRSLSSLAVNYWTSNPVVGVRFEMLLPPPRVVSVAGSWVEFAFLVSSGAARLVLAGG